MNFVEKHLRQEMHLTYTEEENIKPRIKIKRGIGILIVGFLFLLHSFIVLTMYDFLQLTPFDCTLYFRRFIQDAMTVCAKNPNVSKTLL